MAPLLFDPGGSILIKALRFELVGQRSLAVSLSCFAGRLEAL